MLDLYGFATPNGRKISIMLEELGVPYRAHLVNILQGDQFKPEFLAISPNNKIPALVDPEGDDGAPLAIFESGAILVYLAEKYGQFLPKTPSGRAATLQWLFWQVGGVGPMFGQAGYFVRFAKEDVPHAKARYTDEVKRLLGVMEKQLSASAWLSGEEYTIADMATAPWVAGLDFYGMWEIMEPYPQVRGWLERVRARPAVQRGWDVTYA